MLKTCEGSYHGGVVVLKEQPEGLNSGPVLVTFLPSSDAVSSDSGVAEGVGQAIEQARSLFRTVPSSRVLSDELVAERRREACNE